MGHVRQSWVLQAWSDAGLGRKHSVSFTFWLHVAVQVTLRWELPPPHSTLHVPQSLTDQSGEEGEGRGKGRMTTDEPKGITAG